MAIREREHVRNVVVAIDATQIMDRLFEIVSRMVNSPYRTWKVTVLDVHKLFSAR